MKTKSLPVALAVSFLIVGLVSTDAVAQRGRGRGRGKAANGPSFCRSGAGHPVYGRQWCLEQGFGLGEQTWRRAEVRGARFRRAPKGPIENPQLGAREIAEILTDVVLDEIFGESSYDSADLSGTWRGGSDDGLLVLEVSLGGRPVAELTDTDLDDEVDVVLVAER